MTLKVKAVERLVKFSKTDAGTYRYVMAPELYSSLSQDKVIKEADERHNSSKKMGLSLNNMVKNLRLSRFWVTFAASLNMTMMKKVLLLMMMSMVAMTGFAQTEATAEVTESASAMKFAYLSYDSVMLSMPKYAEMQQQMAEMNKQYEAEMTRVENEFNKQYESFLDGQASFPQTILQKRQSELQEMLDKNINFKKESQRLLKDTEANMLNTIKAKINGAVNDIAKEKGYAFVLNMDERAVTFINPAMGEDITEAVKAKVNE